MLDTILRWRSKWRRLAAHLEENGVRAPATVVEIASWGSETASSQGEIDLEDELIKRMPGETLAPSNTGAWYVRKTKLRIRPADEPEFEMKGKIRYGDHGLEIPKQGDEITVVYDPGDHSKVEEDLAKRADGMDQQMDQAQSMLEQAQQFMQPKKKSDEGD